MEELEISAKTVEEAIQHGLKQLGVSREEVEVDVVREGRQGILGMGAEDAIVRVRPLVPVSSEGNEICQSAKAILEELLHKMELDATVVSKAPLIASASDESETSLSFDILGDDLGILIGRHGETLACLQYIVRIVLAHQTKSWVPLIIDVEGYKQRRYESLQHLAKRTADQVRVRRAPFTLRPMPPFERRIIHLALADNPHVATESIGTGESRRVTIAPKAR